VAAVCSLLISRHRSSLLSSHSRAFIACVDLYHYRRYRQFLDPCVFVYANALHAVISSRERWASAKLTADTVRLARDRALSDIGNSPARAFPPETVRQRVNHAYEDQSSEKVAFLRDKRISPLQLALFPRYLDDIANWITLRDNVAAIIRDQFRLA